MLRSIQAICRTIRRGNLPRVLFLSLCAAQFCSLVSCEVAPEVASRRAYIHAEPAGNYFIGRRFHLKGTRLWGYLRRPREPWNRARLVMMNESVKRQPDRLPELNENGPSYGYDHNYEYRIQGRYSGGEVYDPNSNLVVPEFVLTGYSLINRGGGFLIRPGDMGNQRRLPELW